MIEKHIVLEDIDPVMFYGVNNAHLQMIKSLYPKLRIVARDNVIRVLGDEEEMAKVEEDIEQMRKHLLKYNMLNDEDILDIVKGKQTKADSVKGVLVYSISGRPIKSRSENQQQLIDAYEKNDMVFAVGPAGTGKTYLSIALAVKALDDVSLEIPDGQFIGLIGHTGSGKSTLVQHLNGLIKASSGHIYFNGKDIDDDDFKKKELRSKVGLVFQYPEHQLFEADVFSDVCFGPKNLGLTKKEAELRAYEALKKVGLPDDLFYQSPFELSGGQKRRVAIAGVLAMKPEVLILDEPTAGLDPKGRTEILEQISELRRESGITILLVSHSMEDVAEYVDRILVMNKGKLVYDDKPREVFKHYKELEQIGLAAPQVTYIMHELKEIGMDVDVDATTIEEAAESIKKAL